MDAKALDVSITSEAGVRFATAIDSFMSALRSLDFAFPLAIEAISTAATSRIEGLRMEWVRDDDAQEDIVNFLNLLNKAIESKESGNVEIKNPAGLFKFVKGFLSLNEANDLSARSFLITTEGQIDILLEKIVKCMCIVRPDVFSLHSRQVKLGDVIASGSLESYKNLIVEQEIEGLLRKGHAAQIDWIQKQIEFDLISNTPTWSDFMEVTERRNLFAHTDGKISSQYIASAAKHRFGVPGTISVGEKIAVTPDYFNKAWKITLEHGLMIAFLSWFSTVKKNSQENLEAIKTLSNVIFELKEYEWGDVARKLFFNVSKFCKFHDDSIHIIEKIEKSIVGQKAGADIGK